MPVLSDPHHDVPAELPGRRATYFFLGTFVLLAGIFINQRRRLSAAAHMGPQSISPNAANLPEKRAIAGNPTSISTSNPTSLISETPSAPPAKPRIEGPHLAPGQPPPFVPSLPSSPVFGSEINTWTIGSYEPTLAMGMLPRRRSYTKNTPDGGEVSGEIVVAEGWRRHTRVFGGGVCKACEESDRKMTE